ncbi:unnamed protein product [Durusdinium trenchii]|uniref:Uncharacterized protein n=1 Tax=Durusdinium trenchii TaxID=1381693 RepID=A0ABP0K5N7_9DINO
MQGMVGSGRSSIAAVAELSRANVADMGKSVPQAVAALASLGSWGNNASNSERDMHRWVRNLYQFGLETYDVKTAAHKAVAEIVIWSMRHALTGVFPRLGAFEEPLTGHRATLCGKQVANGFRFAYFGFKSDCKTGLQGPCKTFTPSNTGLDSTDYPELGSVFKAAAMKTVISFFATYAQEISVAHAEAR